MKIFWFWLSHRNNISHSSTGIRLPSLDWRANCVHLAAPTWTLRFWHRRRVRRQWLAAGLWYRPSGGVWWSPRSGRAAVTSDAAALATVNNDARVRNQRHTWWYTRSTLRSCFRSEWLTGVSVESVKRISLLTICSSYWNLKPKQAE